MSGGNKLERNLKSVVNVHAMFKQNLIEFDFIIKIIVVFDFVISVRNLEKLTNDMLQTETKNILFL